MNTTTVMAGQLTLDDLINGVIVELADREPELRDDLIHRRDLPLAAIGGPERLLFRLVQEGLNENALRGAAGLVIQLEHEALSQRRGAHDQLPA